MCVSKAASRPDYHFQSNFYFAFYNKGYKSLKEFFQSDSTMKKQTLILMKSCLQVTVVLALLGISYVFLRTGLKEYLEGKTDFSYSKQPITPEDVPVMTICVYSNKPLEYGRNIIIKTMATEKSWQNLFGFGHESIWWLELGSRGKDAEGRRKTQHSFENPSQAKSPYQVLLVENNLLSGPGIPYA